jgi:hypothetical protein
MIDAVLERARELAASPPGEPAHAGAGRRAGGPRVG